MKICFPMNAPDHSVAPLFLFTRPKHYLDPSTLSWVIIQKLTFSQILRRGHYCAKSLLSVTGFKFDILFMVIYTYVTNTIWFHQSFHELSSGHGLFSQILSKKGAITLSDFGGVWPDSNFTFLLWLYTYVQNMIWDPAILSWVIIWTW